MLHTKRETILTMTGVQSIRARYASLKLPQANKILLNKDVFYVKYIVKQNWDSTEGFGADIRAVFGEWEADDEFKLLCSDLPNGLAANESQKSFQKFMKNTMERLDFEHCKAALSDSAIRGSGQARLVDAATQRQLTHAMIPQLKVEIPRHQMVLFINTISGCDFITPNNHAKKPKCKFCGARKVYWPHILFECEQRSTRGFTLIADFLRALSGAQMVSKNFMRNILSQTKRKICCLWNTKNMMKLFEFVMTVTDDELLTHATVRQCLVSVTSKHIYLVSKEWSAR